MTKMLQQAYAVMTTMPRRAGLREVGGGDGSGERMDARRRRVERPAGRARGLGGFQARGPHCPRVCLPWQKARTAPAGP